MHHTNSRIMPFVVHLGLQEENIVIAIAIAIAAIVIVSLS